MKKLVLCGVLLSSQALVHALDDGWWKKQLELGERIHKRFPELQGKQVLSDEQIEELRELTQSLVDDQRCDSYCEKWAVQQYPYDVDKLKDLSLLERHDWETISPTWGTRISLAIRSKDQRRRAFKIANIVQNSRTDKDIFLRTVADRFIYEEDKCILDDMIDWVEEHRNNVDLITVHWENIGKELERLLTEQDRQADALKLAAAVQPFRTDRSSVFNTLRGRGNRHIFTQWASTVALHPQ